MHIFNQHPVLTYLLIAVFAVNQWLLGSVGEAVGATRSLLFALTGAEAAEAMEIMMPIPNKDGLTTHLQMMPTITPVAGEPRTSDVVADAKVVMVATGTPFYAPEGVSFDDPVGALATWGSYESLELVGEIMERYQRLISIFPCNFCCGSVTRVTMNGNCGCAHAKAARGFFKYMLEKYGDTYSDDQLFGEAYRWQAVWYPSGVVEDYLLGTGRVDVMGHKTHGGAGEDGMHGQTQILHGREVSESEVGE